MTGIMMPRDRKLTRQEKLRMMAMGISTICKCGYTAPIGDFTPAHLPLGQFICPCCGIRWGKVVSRWTWTDPRTLSTTTGSDVDIEIHDQLELALGV